jgi:hypothetical protein
MELTMSRPEGKNDQEHTQSTDEDKNENRPKTGRLNDDDECEVSNSDSRQDSGNRAGGPWPGREAELAGDGIVDPD